MFSTTQLFAFLTLFSYHAQSVDYRSGYHWARTSKSFTLGVVRSVRNSGTNNWEEIFNATLESWSASSVIDLHMIDGGYPNGSCASLDGYVHVCNGNYGKTTWNGKSQWSYYIEDGGHEGHIFSCVVLLNDNEWVYGEESKVLCHELGHCLGLGHPSEDGGSDATCMDYSSGVVESRGPGVVSLNVLEDVYAHTDTWNSFHLVEPTRNTTQRASQGTESNIATLEPSMSSVMAPTPGITSATGCSNSGNQGSCKSRKNCKWNKELGCVAKSRRLEDDCDYPYEPTNFDIPASATLLACTSETVTFELVEVNIATRYNVVLSHHMRRKRQLRRSW